MDDLIEAMARAILKTRLYDCEPDAYDSLESFWIEIDPDHWIDARDEARAALAAINARGDRVVPGVGELLRSVERAEAGAGTLPAKDAVKLRPEHWHAVCREARALSASPYAPEKEPAL
jgi:hypothetical protein